MRVLITGGAGYIGSVVTEVLVESGHDVVVFDNLQNGHAEAVHPGAEFVHGDLANLPELEALFARRAVDAVVHMAAEALIPESMTNPARFFRANVLCGMNLLDVMVRAHVARMVFSSTAAVYGAPAEVPIPEDSPKVPVNSYGESKWMFERILDWYQRAYGLRYVTFRYMNAAGATDRFGEDHGPETHLIPLVLRAARDGGQPIAVYGTDYDTPDGTCIRDYIHVLDVAEAHVSALLQVDRLGARVYNVGNGSGFSVLEVLEASREVTGRPIPYVAAPRRSGDPGRLVADARRLRSELGWAPRYPDLKDIIASAWRWHLAHPQGYRGHAATT